MFFGGYRAVREVGGELVVVLTPDMPDLEALPDAADLGERTHGKYAVFWPSTESPAHEDEYRDDFKFHSWRPARLRISSGQLLTDEEEAGVGELSGRIYTLRPLTKKKGKNWRDVAQEDALPPICPGCGADYSSKERRFNTPLRSHRTGFQKACQVIASGLVREMPEPEASQQPRKLVIFSDSRQDAAKLAAGIERDHYRDMVRVAMMQAPDEFRRCLGAFCRQLVEDFPKFATELAAKNAALAAEAGLPASDEDAELARWFEDFDEELANRATRWARGRLVATDSTLQDLMSLIIGFPSRFGLPQVAMAAFRELLKCGISPGGTERDFLSYRESKDGPYVSWWKCYDWQGYSPRQRDPLSRERRPHQLDGAGLAGRTHVRPLPA